MPDLLPIFKTVGLPDYTDPAIEVAADKIVEQLDTRTAVKDLEHFWNQSLLDYLELEKNAPEHLGYMRTRRENFDRIKRPYDEQEHFFIGPKVYFRVLDKAIKEDDTVRLLIPQGPFLLFMIGWRLSKGTLYVTGTVGDLGYQAHGTAHLKLVGDTDGDAAFHASGQTVFEIEGNVSGGLAALTRDNVQATLHGNAYSVGEGAQGSVHCTVYGNVRGSVARSASGNTQIHIKGSVQGSVGEEATDNVHIVVDGDAGDYSGYGIKKNVTIKIGGNAGSNLGTKAQGNTSIEVRGNAGKRVGHRAYRNAQVIVHGNGEPGIPNPSFEGVIMINEQVVNIRR